MVGNRMWLKGLLCTVQKLSLISGSFNWTMTAAMGNRENVLVTNHRETVSKYIQEFDRLWIEYAP